MAEKFKYETRNYVRLVTEVTEMPGGSSISIVNGFDVQRSDENSDFKVLF